MNCPEALDLLGDFVDSELEEPRRNEVRAHLDSCSKCMRAYDELVALKRLVQDKIHQPKLPGGLSARIFRQTRATAGSRRTRPGGGASHGDGAVVRIGPFVRKHRRKFSTLAAVLLLGVTTWLSYEVFKPAPLVHGEVVEALDRHMARKIRPEPVPLPGEVSALLEQIRNETGVPIDEIPRLERARLIRYEKDSMHGRPCVRLDYQCLQAPDKTCPTSVISVFALPITAVELPEKLAENHSILFPCPCLQLKGLTVYCFCTESTAFNLVSWYDGDDIRQRLRGRLK